MAKKDEPKTSIPRPETAFEEPRPTEPQLEIPETKPDNIPQMDNYHTMLLGDVLRLLYRTNAMLNEQDDKDAFLKGFAQKLSTELNKDHLDTLKKFTA